MASRSRPGRSALSDRLKGMRFMKQGDESEVREKLRAEQEQREREAHWTVENISGKEEYQGPIVVLEEGISDNPMTGRLGRQSFGNFNAALERQNKPEQKKESTLAPPSDHHTMKSENVTQEEVKGQPARAERKKFPHADGLRKISRAGIVKKESKPLDQHRTIKKSKLFGAGRRRR